jgi:hypothetical protein
MNGNYESQMNLANERVRGRLQEGAAHRRARQGTTKVAPRDRFVAARNESRASALRLALAIPLLTGALVGLWYLLGGG